MFNAQRLKKVDKKFLDNEVYFCNEKPGQPKEETQHQQIKRQF